MESVQQAVREGRNENGRDAEEHDPRKKRITGSEHFSLNTVQFVDRSHSRQDHRSVEQRVDPLQLCKVMIPEHTDPQAEGEDDQSEQKMPKEPTDKLDGA